MGSAGTTCGAPSSAMYFRPDGIVAACCASWHVLGRVTGPERRSLRDIWDGYQAEVLRDAVAAGDWAYGCWECGERIDQGDRQSSLAADFDDVSQPRGSRYPRMIDFAMSNRCNLQCVMCNGGLSSSIRKHREKRPALPSAYDDRFFAELQEFLPHLRRASFKGGEPFLAPENHRVWDEMLRAGLDCEISVTTNGTVLTDRTRSYVERLGMGINVSVDAVDIDLLRRIRVGVDPAALWRNIADLRRITSGTGAPFILSFCLMAMNWRELPAFYAEVERLEAQPNLIWVDGPERYGLLGMRPEELRSTADELACLRTEWSDRLSVGSITAIDGVIDRLIGDQPRDVHVDVSPRHLSRNVTAAVSDGHLPTADVPRLELTLRDGVVRAVDVPDWAGWLHPEEWIGMGLEEFMPSLAALTGVAMRGTMSALTGGARRVELAFGSGPDSPPPLDVIYLPGGNGVSRMLLAPLTASVK